MKEAVRQSVILFLIAAILGLVSNFLRKDSLRLITPVKLVKQGDRLEKIPLFITPASVTEEDTDKEQQVSSEDTTFFTPHGPISIGLDRARELYLGKKALFIDSREIEEYQEGHITGALLIEYNNLRQYIPLIRSLGKDTTLVIYCSGDECNSSMELAYQLYELGFGDIYYFPGGWLEWKKAGLPTTEEEQP